MNYNDQIYYKNMKDRYKKACATYIQRKKTRCLIFCDQKDTEYIYQQLSLISNYIAIVYVKEPINLIRLIDHAKLFYINKYHTVQQILQFIHSAQSNNCTADTLKLLERDNLVGFLLEYIDDYDIDPMVIVDSISHKLKSNLKICGLKESQNNKIHFIYKEKELLLSGDMSADNKPIGVMVYGGYGDAILLLSLLKEMIEIHLDSSKRVVIISTSTKVLSFLKYYLDNCEFKDYTSLVKSQYIDLRTALIHEGTYSKIIDLITLDDYGKPIVHIYEYIANILGLDNPGKILAKFSPKLTKISSEIDHKLMESKRNNKYLVGLQFCSDSAPLGETYSKEWPIEYAIELDNLCYASNIQLINLVPHEHFTLPHAIDMSSLQIHELFALIQKLDAVVGIDSCCGHMAGLLGVPNITLWGDKLSFRQIQYIFRPLTMNFSLCPKDAKLSNIKPQNVYEKLWLILNKKIELKRELITLKDSQNGLGVEWIHD